MILLYLSQVLSYYPSRLRAQISILGRTVKYIYRKLFVECTPLQGYVAHIPHGIVNVFLATHVHWSAALLFGIGYMIFQDGHERNNLDPAHYDLAGWLLGLVIGGGIYVIFF